MKNDIGECYHLFELEPGATPEAVKQAYRDLLKVWHPDRFPDPKLQRRATEKTKALNEAYLKLSAHLARVCTESLPSAEEGTEPEEAEEDLEMQGDLEGQPDFASTLESAQQGDWHSQIELAEMYRAGTEIPKNETEAFRWYLLAASQGNSEAMYQVGMGYLLGLGVEPDKNEALKWLSRLAYPETTEDSGFPSRMVEAQAGMAAIYYRTPGKPHDPAKGYGWLLLAVCYAHPWTDEVTPFNAEILAAAREKVAILQDAKSKLELELTPKQRAKGQQMAADLFRPKDYIEARVEQLMREKPNELQE
jgi:hypothetical protein